MTVVSLRLHQFVIYAIFLLSVIPLWAAVPVKINYQGRLKESGLPANGTRAMMFAIYDAAENGTELWNSGDLSVEVSSGLFRTVIAPETMDWGGGSRWLQVSVNGTALVPREEIHGAAYSFYASTSGYTQSAGQATYIAGGSAGEIPYQLATDQTRFIAAGTPGYILQSNGTESPAWVANTGGALLSSTNTWTAAQRYVSTITVEGVVEIMEAGATPHYVTRIKGADQNGDITYTLPAGAGAMGQVLATNAAGELYWSNVTADQSFENITITSPTVQGEVLAGTGLTMPAFTLKGDIQGAAGQSPSITGIDGFSGGSAFLNSSVTSPVYTGVGAVTLNSGGANALTLDTGAGAAINIGRTNATSVNIGRAAQTTTVFGTMVANSFQSSNVTITGGSISGISLGADTPATGKFTSIEATNYGNALVLSGSIHDEEHSNIQGAKIVFTGTEPGQITTTNGQNLGITPAGNLGVGTIIPKQKLHVAGKSVFDGNVGIGTTDPQYPLDVYGDIRSTGVVRGNVFMTTGRSHFAEIAGEGMGYLAGTTGNIGIGVTEPTEKLDVGGAIKLEPASAPGETGHKMYNVGGSLFWDGINISSGTSKWTLLDNGNVYRQSGNVGIGQTAPGYKVDVIGDVNVTGNFRVNGTPLDAGMGGSGDAGYLPKFTAARMMGNSQLFDDGTNVGVGTGSPDEKLYVSGNVKVHSGAVIVDRPGRGQMVLASTGTYWGVVENTANDQWALGYGPGTGGLGTPVITWTGTGRTGIGTTAPGSMLNVAGNMAVGSGYAGTAAPANSLVVQGNMGAGTAGPDERIVAAQGNNSTVKLLTTDQNSTSVSRIGFYSSESNGSGGTRVTEKAEVNATGTGVYGAADMVFKTGQAYWNSGWSAQMNERMRILSNGNVGVGTSAPVKTLDVAGDIQASGTIFGNLSEGYASGGWKDMGTMVVLSTTSDSVAVGYSTTTGKFAVSGNMGVGTATPVEMLDVNGAVRLAQVSAPATPADRLYNVDGSLYWNDINLSSGTSKWTQGAGSAIYRQAGNVGIGTTDPKASLEVAGNMALSGGDRSIINRSNNALSLGANNVEAIRIASGGNVGVGTTDPQAKLDVAGDVGLSGGDRAINNRSNNALTIGTNSTERMRVTKEGNVGIGQTNPDDKLAVNGDVNITGVYKINGTPLDSGLGGAGTAHYVSKWINDTALTDSDIYSNGNVGIGTTAPREKLQVEGNIKANQGHFIAGSTGTVQMVLPSKDSANYGLMQNDGANTWTFGYGASSTTLGTPMVTWNTSSRLGIGTTAPSYSMSFEGQSDKTIGVERYIHAFGGTGRSLTVVAGGAGTGSSNTAGGNLVLSGGTSRGTGSSNIYFQGAPSGSSGAGDNAPVTRMTILGNGNVGIGTAGPGYTLDVTGDERVTGDLRVEGDVRLTGTGKTIFGNVAQGYFAGGWYDGGTSVRLATVEDQVAIGYGDAGTAKLAVSGNVGIGTTDPLEKLHVDGPIYVATTTAPGTPAHRLYNVAGNLYWNDINLSGGTSKWTQGDESNIYRLAGNVGIGMTDPGSALDLSGAFSQRSMTAPTAAPGGQGRVYFDSGTNKFRVSENGSDYTDLVTAGWTGSGSAVYLKTVTDNVGVGTTNPKGKMDILGGVAIGSYAGVATPPANSIIVSSFVGVGISTPTTALDINGALSMHGVGSPAVAPAGQGRVYYDSTENKIKISQNGDSYVDLVNTSGGWQPASPFVHLLNDTDNVGIGTAAPKGKLDVTGGVSVGTYAGNTAPPSNGMIISGNVGISTGNPQGLLDVGSKLVVTSLGRVGVNTWNFTDEIAGNDTFKAAAANTLFGFTDNGTLTQGYLTLSNGTIKGYPGMIDNEDGFVVGSHTNHPFTVRTANQNRMRVSETGGFAFGSTYYANDPGSNNLVVEGKVGIGTTAPTQKLEVAGNIKNTGYGIATSSITFADGTVLTSSKTVAVSPSGSNGYVQFNNNGSFGSDSNLFWDNTNKRLGIGTTAPNSNAVSHFHKSQNTGTVLFVTNDNSGTSASSLIRAGLNPSVWTADYVQVGILGANFTPIGILKAKTMLFESVGSNFVLSNYNDTEPIQFLTSTSRTERMRIQADGNIGVGDTNPLGKMQIRSGSTSKATMILKAEASQTASLLELRNSADTPLLTIERGDNSGGGDVAGIHIITPTGKNSGSITLHLDGTNGASGPYLQQYYNATDDTYQTQVVNKPTARITFRNYSATGMPSFTLDPTSGGRLGVGVTNPSAKLHVLGDAILGNTSTSYVPANGAGYTLRVDGSDYSSIGFHDAGDTLGSIRFSHNYGFEIGNGDGTYGSHNAIFAGKVGIGVSSPAQKLEVAGNIKNTGYGIATSSITFADGTVMISTATLPVGNNYVRKSGDTMTGVLTAPNITAMSSMTITGNAFSVGTSTLVVKNGMVGIGTTNPDFPLHVVGTRVLQTNSMANSTTMYEVVDSPNYTTNNNYILFGVDTTGGTVGYGSGGDFMSVGAGGTGTARDLILHNYNAKSVVVATNNTERMRIAGDGKIGIGTTAPQYQFNINQVAGQTKGIFISGDEYYQSGNGAADKGIVLLAGVNRTGNRQLWIGDKDDLGSSTQAFFRYGVGAMAAISAVSGNGVNRLPIYLGSDTSGVGVGFGIVENPYAMLHVRTGQTTSKGFIVQASTGQTVNLMEWQTSTGAGLGGINATGNLSVGTTLPTSKFDVLDGSITVRGTNAGLQVAGPIRNVNYGVYTSSIVFTDGTMLSSTRTISGGSPSGSTGYVQFNNAGSFGGNSNLFWDNAGGKLGINTTAPQAAMQITNGGLEIRNSANDLMASISTGTSGGMELRFRDVRTGGEAGGLFAGLAGVGFGVTNSGYFSIALEPEATFGNGGNNAMMIMGTTLNTHFGNMLYTQADIGGQVNILPSAATKQGLIIQGASGQSANMTEWRNSSGVPGMTVTPDGQGFIFNRNNRAQKHRYMTYYDDVGGVVLYQSYNSSFNGSAWSLDDTAKDGIAQTFGSYGGYTPSAVIAWNRYKVGGSMECIGGVASIDGSFRLGNFLDAEWASNLGTKLFVRPNTSSDKAVVVRGVASQSGNLTEWQNSTSIAMSAVNKNGSFGIGTSTPTSTLDVFNGSVTVRGTNAGLQVAGPIRNANYGVYTSSIVFTDGTMLSSTRTISGGSGSYVAKTGDTMTGSLSVTTMTVTGNAFSVGTSTLVVKNGMVGIGTTEAGTMLQLEGDSYFTKLYSTDAVFPRAFQFQGLFAGGDISSTGSSIWTEAYTGTGTSADRINTIYARPHIGGNGSIVTFTGLTVEPIVDSGASGDVTNLMGISITGGGYDGTTAVTNWNGIEIGNPAAGANKKGLSIDAISGGSASNYAIYSEGGNNYFEGSVGIGKAVHPAVVYIATNTASANQFMLVISTKNTANSEAFVVKGNGFVGVNTSTPTTNLYVVGNSTVTGNLHVGGSFSFNGAYAPSSIVTGQVTATSSMTVAGNAFSVGTSTFAVKNGRVGIGTSNPIVGLHISSMTTFIEVPTATTPGLVLQTTDQDDTNHLIESRLQDGTPMSYMNATGHWNLGYAESGAALSLGPTRFSNGTIGLEIIPSEGHTAPLLRVANATGGEAFTVAANGNTGIGTSAPASALEVRGTMFSKRNAITYGANITIDWNNGNTQSIILAGNTTLTFTNGQDGAKYTLILKQDTTGSRTITWPGTVRFSGGMPTQLTTTANKTDYVGLVYNGIDSTYDVMGESLNY